MAEPVTTAHPDVLYPLSMFRLARGLSNLVYETIEPNTVPQPYAGLLVHQGDMTSRLENFHGGPIHVQKLTSSNDGKAYYREVVLQTQEGKPVEYGAIEITLANLPEELHEDVLAAKRPLGGILNDARISYLSSPRAFLKALPDDPIRQALGLTEGAGRLYGRSNEITGYGGESYARIVEILPPA